MVMFCGVVFPFVTDINANANADAIVACGGTGVNSFLDHDPLDEEIRIGSGAGFSLVSFRGVWFLVVR